MGGLSISAIIPALNERSSIERALGCTARPGVERIVVDGGSTDGTAAAARALGAERVISCAPGRAEQMNAGYRAAGGDALLFLHADTWLESGWDSALREALEDEAVAGGAFRLRFESSRAAYRCIEAGAMLRARVLGLPYGDQGLFVRRQALEAAGGIAPVPIFEDLDLVRSICSAGRLAILRPRAFTSPRRYERRGLIGTVLRNNLALGAYLLGLDREAVRAWYVRKPSK